MRNWSIKAAMSCIERNSICKVTALKGVLGTTIGVVVAIDNRSAGLTVLGAADYLNKQTKENISVIFAS